MSRFWPQRRQIVRCNMAIAMALPREMRPGAHVLSGGVVAYNDDAQLVAALHRGDRVARTVLVQRYEPLVERLVAGALGIDSEISDVIQDVFVGVFIMGIVVFHINREFDSIDSARLTELRE